MSKTKRKAIPKDVEAKILIRSRRRCCLCSFWNNDLEQKDGQLAHIDRDSSNANDDNLAYLCFSHHNEYDAKQLQGKNIAAQELRHAREELYRKINPNIDAVFSVRLKLNRDFDSFTNEDQRQLLALLEEVLAKHGNIQVTDIRPGSVNLTIELNPEETRELFSAIERGVLDQYDLIDAQVVAVKELIPVLEFWPTYVSGISSHAVPKKQVAEVVNSPDSQQHILRGETVPFKDSRCSLYTKHFPESSDPYTVLVLSMFHHAHRAVGIAIRVYASDVEHSRDWKPVKVLQAFLDKYGVDETYEGLGTKRMFVAIDVTVPFFARSEAIAIAYVHSLRRRSSSDRIGDVEFLNLHFYEAAANHVFIELAFGISLRQYAVDLRRHGVQIPEHFFARTAGDLF